MIACAKLPRVRTRIIRPDLEGNTKEEAVAATIGAVVALGRYGLAQAGARRSELLRLEGAHQDPHLRGRNLSDALESMSIVGATQGDAQAQPVVKRFFQGMVLGALYLIIAVLKVRKWWKATFGGSEMLRGLNAQKIALYAGMGAVFAFAGALVVAAAGAAIFLAPMLLLAGAIYVIYRVVKGAVKALEGIGAAFAAAGGAMVDGLKGGILGGGPGLMATIRNMGRQAIDAFKRTLGIASPSKITMGIGYDLGRGNEIGIDRSTPRVRAAAVRMSRASIGAMQPANDNAVGLRMGARVGARAVAGPVAPAIGAFAGVSAGVGLGPRPMPSAPTAPELRQPFGAFAAPVAPPPRKRDGIAGRPIQVTLNLTINAAGDKTDDIKAAVVEALGPALEQLAVELGAKRSDAEAA